MNLSLGKATALLVATFTLGIQAASAAPINLSVEAIGSIGFGPKAGSTVIDFNSGLPSGPTFSGSGAGFGLYTGTTSGLAATPFGSSTQYYSTGLGTTTITFEDDFTYLGLLWGSVDGYNDIKFYKDGVLIASINGSAIINPADGNQGLGGTFYVNFELEGGFDKVELHSSNYSFEIDDLAYGNSYDEVPEPATALLLGGGLAAISLARRRRAAKA
jgi:hypothetical protein